jgi:hypothetical protein
LKNDGSLVAWGDDGYGQSTVPLPNSGYYQEFAGVTPDSGSVAGGFNVTLRGTGLCNGLMSDVTNVTLCGIPASLLSVSGSTQIVVQAGSAPAVLTGDILIESISNGSTLSTNAFTYVKGNQTISFPTLGTNSVAATIGLNAEASSGLPVSYSIVSGPGIISNLTNLTFSSTGQVSVVAIQSGNAGWNPALSVTNLIDVIEAYAAWAAALELTGTATEDDDSDGANNLLEYALMGNPTNHLDRGTEPSLVQVSNVFHYIHLMRNDDLSLIYTVESRTNLLSGDWAPIGTATETNFFGDAFDEVSHLIQTNQPQSYLRLNVTKP